MGTALIIKGKVGRGKGVGRILGYPTANIGSCSDLKNGVYYTLVCLEGEWLPALAIKGTAGNDVEIHIIDWDGDIYERDIEARVLEKMRDIIHFSDEESLLAQIKQDIIKAKEYFKDF